YAGLRAEGVQYHCYGWPAPPSDKVQLITNSFIMPNMIAKAVTGTSTKDALAWAENEMKKVMAGGADKAIGSGGVAKASRRPSVRHRVGELLDREQWLGPILVVPA